MRNEMVSGSAPALGRRRVRLAPDMLKIPPAYGCIFSTQPAGARADAPEGGRAPRDHGAAAPLARRGLSRTLEGGFCASQQAKSSDISLRKKARLNAGRVNRAVSAGEITS